jgi:hypothetical protein
MRNLFAPGMVLVVLGAVGLLFGHFRYTDSKPLLDAGPIQSPATRNIAFRSRRLPVSSFCLRGAGSSSPADERHEPQMGRWRPGAALRDCSGIS